MKKLCVFFGGESCEHDISVITGMQLAKAVQSDVEKIYIGLDNHFYLATGIERLDYFSNKEKIKLKEVVILYGSVFKKGKFLKKLFDIDVAINCCHGGIGENGVLSAFFELNKIKNCSSDMFASAVAMNKYVSKLIVGKEVNTVKGVLVTKSNFAESVEKIKEEMKDELVVKPNRLGSSIGVKVCNKENMIEQINAIFEMGDDALVEEKVCPLREFNQACIKTKEGLVLSAIEEPITKSQFLTFEDKYNHDSKQKCRDRILPAQISPELEEQIMNSTSKIYSLLGMNGVARIDYLYDQQEQKLYFNEINTNPGSMAFYLFEKVGIDYLSLVDMMRQNPVAEKKYFYFESAVLSNKLL